MNVVIELSVVKSENRQLRAELSRVPVAIKDLTLEERRKVIREILK